MSMIRHIVALAACILTAYPDLNAQQKTTLSEEITAMASDPALTEAAVGICVRTADGGTLAEINSGKMLVPASNMKLITTGAALDRLGSGFRFGTSISHDGEIRDGVLHGNLYVTGGGDPTLGSRDSIAVPLEQTFTRWERLVREAGIRRIEGLVIGDGRWFEGMAEEPTWLWNDIGTYYGAGTTGLMFYENMLSFKVSAGPETGSQVNIAPSYPDVPWMEFRYACRTGKAGTGDRLYMYTSDLAPVAEIRGTFGVDRAAKRVDCANKFPEYTCASLFAAHLEKRGIRNRGAADTRLETAWMKEEGKEKTRLGTTYSPELQRIVFETNHASNNLYAETLLRTLGKEICEDSCYDSSYVAMDAVLKDMGADTSHGLHIQDGSGLSRQNLVSPDFMCTFLEVMIRQECFEDYLASLPFPGGNGTLQYNMKGRPAELRTRIRVKSGSMNGIRCYSGYILPADCPRDADGRILELTEDMKARIMIFSIMTGNCTAPMWKVRPLLDRIMAAIAGQQDLRT